MYKFSALLMQLCIQLTVFFTCCFAAFVACSTICESATLAIQPLSYIVHGISVMCRPAAEIGAALPRSNPDLFNNILQVSDVEGVMSFTAAMLYRNNHVSVNLPFDVTYPTRLRMQKKRKAG